MNIAAVEKDFDSATLRLSVEYSATAERVWRLWADPRQLERWWGPPTHPATVTDHDLSAGGTVRYYMTGPDGEKYHGGWRVISTDAPRGFEVEDFFADDDGNEMSDMPVARMTVSVEDVGNGVTRMTIETRYASTEAMTKVLEMGMEEGIKQALSQTDALLAEQPT